MTRCTNQSINQSLIQAQRNREWIIAESENAGALSIREMVERDMRKHLLEASRISAVNKNSTSLFSFRSTPQPVVEIDGTVAREFFTILNSAACYTDDQQFNIYLFSSLHSWLTSIYLDPETYVSTQR